MPARPPHLNPHPRPLLFRATLCPVTEAQYLVDEDIKCAPSPASHKDQRSSDHRLRQQPRRTSMHHLAVPSYGPRKALCTPCTLVPTTCKQVAFRQHDSASHEVRPSLWRHHPGCELSRRRASRPRPFSDPRRIAHTCALLPCFIQMPPMGFKERCATQKSSPHRVQ